MTKPLDKRKATELAAIDTPWLTPDEAVTYLRIGSRKALSRLVTEHALPFGRLGGRQRFHRDELDAWLRG